MFAEFISSSCSYSYTDLDCGLCRWLDDWQDWHKMLWWYKVLVISTLLEWSWANPTLASWTTDLLYMYIYIWFECKYMPCIDNKVFTRHELHPGYSTWCYDIKFIWNYWRVPFYQWFELVRNFRTLCLLYAVFHLPSAYETCKLDIASGLCICYFWQHFTRNGQKVI